MAVHIFKDDVKTKLLLSIDASANTINVSNPKGIYNDPPNPSAGQIATLKIIDRIDNPTRKELITYNGRLTITGGYQLTGVVRGIGSTSPSLWEAGCFVVGIVSSEFISSLSTTADVSIVQGEIDSLTTIVNGITSGGTQLLMYGGFNEDVVYNTGDNKVPDFLTDDDGDLYYY